MKNTIKEALEERSLIFRTSHEDDTRTVFELGMALENGRCDTFIDLRTDTHTILIFVVNPNFVPANRRTLVSEFLTRANYGIILGNFEMDFTDGEIRYKTSYAFDDTFPTSKEVFLRNLYTSFNTMDRYLPGIMAVMYANLTPSHAIAQIENATDPSMN